MSDDRYSYVSLAIVRESDYNVWCPCVTPGRVLKFGFGRDAADEFKSPGGGPQVWFGYTDVPLRLEK